MPRYEMQPQGCPYLRLPTTDNLPILFGHNGPRGSTVKSPKYPGEKAVCGITGLTVALERGIPIQHTQALRNTCPFRDPRDEQGNALPREIIILEDTVTCLFPSAAALQRTERVKIPVYKPSYKNPSQ